MQTESAWGASWRRQPLHQTRMVRRCEQSSWRISTRRDSQCQEPEIGINLVCSRDKKKGPSGQGCKWGSGGVEVRGAGRP